MPAPKKVESKEVEEAKAPVVKTVKMYRVDRGEFDAPPDDVANMIKNGWVRCQ